MVLIHIVGDKGYLGLPIMENQMENKMGHEAKAGNTLRVGFDMHRC